MRADPPIPTPAPILLRARDTAARPITTPPAVAAIVPRLLGIDDAMVYLGVSKRQLRYWIASGRLRAVRLDRRLRLDRVQIDQLVTLAMQRDLRQTRRAPARKRVDRSSARDSAPGSIGESITRETAP